jgi:hypothetical protein
MRNEIAETARRHIGYRALPLRHSVYGPAGRDWNGAFVKAIYGEAGHFLPTGSTVELLGLLLADWRVYSRPEPGDIVFYRFPAEGGEPTGQPHAGIVTDTSRWKADRSFLAVEGQTPSGNPKEDQTANGIYERRRYHTDVLAFGRPKFRVPSEAPADAGDMSGPAPISSSNIENGKRHLHIEHVQRALGRAVGLRDATRGLYDGRTRSAMAEFQRRLGRVGQEASGLPDFETLDQLARQTGEFNLKG